MKERPIIFNEEMVRAILEGRKTQTRRPINPQPKPYHDNSIMWAGKSPMTFYESLSCELPILWQRGSTNSSIAERTCPFGKVGDLLWVKETTIIAPKRFNDGAGSNAVDKDGEKRLVQYVATDTDTEASGWYGLKKTPSIHMPQWASRITLEITNIRVETVQDISEDDALKEGIEFWEDRYFDDAQDYYKDYLTMPHEEFNPRPHFTCPIRSFESLWDSIYHNWHKNPWVWMIEFKKL